MTLSLSADQACWLHARAQGLDPSVSGKATNVAQVVRNTFGLQAQDSAAAALQVRVRSVGLTGDDVRRAIEEDRSVVRTWAMRGTLHLIPAEDIRWITSLVGPPALSASRGRLDFHGLDEETRNRGIRLIRDILSENGPLTRAEIAERLAPHGIPVAGQAAPHLLRCAAFAGVLCNGPARGSKDTFVVLDNWVSTEPELPRETALAELARRYLKSYGPASPEDMAAWAGLPIRDARKAWGLISRNLVEVEAAGKPAWVLTEGANRLDEVRGECPRAVRLAGAFDTYLLGYRTRDLALAPEYAKRVNAGGGIIRPTVLVHGRAIGTWRTKRLTRRIEVSTEPFEEFDNIVAEGIKGEIMDLGRFLGVKAL